MLKKKKEKIILPLADPITGAWAEQNFFISIVSPLKTGWDWIMNTHIQLRGSHYIWYGDNKIDSSITFYPYAMHTLSPNIYDLCPFIEKYTIPKDMIRQQYGSFHEYVLCSIKSGYYLSTYLDQFFRKDMGETGYHHPNFIYGFDENEELVYLADNFEANKYKTKTITYKQIDKAFDAVSGNCWEVSVFLYKPKDYNHEFCTGFVKNQIEDYLNPGKGICYLNRTVCQDQNFDNKVYKNEVFFGSDCYGLLNDYLTAVKEDNPEYLDGDWRSFAMLVDHKKLMIKRYGYMVHNSYMSKNNQLEERLGEIEKESEIMLNLFIKYIVTQNFMIVDSLQDKLNAFIKKDIWCMEQFADSIY